MVSSNTIQRTATDSFNIQVIIPNKPIRITSILPDRLRSCLMRLLRSSGVGKPVFKKFFRLLPEKKASPATKRRIITILYKSGVIVANFQSGKTKTKANMAQRPTKTKIFTRDKS